MDQHKTDSDRDLLKSKTAQKEQFNRAHRAKDLWVLKVNKWVQFFPNKQGIGPLNLADSNCN